MIGGFEGAMRRIPSVVLATLLALVGLATANDEAINPVGKPKYYKPGQTARYAVWQDEDGWHLRVTTEKKACHFKGVVRCRGGSFKNLKSVDIEEARLDIGRKLRKKSVDHFSLEDDKKLVFDFETAHEEDGVDWKVSQKAEHVEFDIELAQGSKATTTKHNALKVYIGEKGANPKTVPFSLPAHPQAGKAK
jgi:hypothetical protein